jgi:Na+/H+ antiporter NhaD/arsenite permease-like protein
MTVAAILFCLTYLVIAGQKVPYLRLDRPSGAILGAVSMVVLGVVPPGEAGRDGVNHDTIALLLGMMIIGAYMIEARMFRFASWLTLTRVRGPRRLLVALVLVSGGLSAVLVNDTVCLMFTPLVVQMCRDARLRPLPFLLALCFGSNAGSLATPTGNPQNMIIGTLSGIPYARFTALLALPALLSMAAVAAVLLVAFRRDLPARPVEEPHLPRPALQPRLAGLCLVVLLGVLCGFLAGAPMAWTAMAGAAVLLLLGRRPPRRVLGTVDWVLLVFFAGLFIVTYGVGRSGIAAWLFHAVRPALGDSVLRQATVFGAFTVVASQIVSNVPFVLLASHFLGQLADPPFLWLSTALFATLAGNLTTVGSVANLIVIEGAREVEPVRFWSFLRYGAPVTAVTILVAFGALWGERALGLFGR